MDVSSLLQEHRIDLVCLDQPIDTSSPQGKLFLTILAAFAEFEHDLIRERTRDGLAGRMAVVATPGSRCHRRPPRSAGTDAGAHRPYSHSPVRPRIPRPPGSTARSPQGILKTEGANRSEPERKRQNTEPLPVLIYQSRQVGRRASSLPAPRPDSP